MRCRQVAVVAGVVVGVVLALPTGVPAGAAEAVRAVDAAEASAPPDRPRTSADALAATGAALRAERSALLTRIATLSDEAEGAHARFVTAQQRVAAAEASAAAARAALTEHVVDAFVHNGSLVAAARVRGGIFAEVVVDVDDAVVDAVGAAAASADAERDAAEAALAEAEQVEVEVAAARQALEATIEVNEARTAEARAEEERNALARRLAEEERARQEAERERQEALEAERQRQAAATAEAVDAMGRLARTPAPGGGAPTQGFATLPGTPTGEAGGAAPVGGYTDRHLDRFARATAGQADLMARHRFGPVTELPPGATRSGQVVEGMASWYGPGFDGRPTASGALFDQQGWTVASKELPLGTVLLVTRGERSVLALVNDRGPYVAGRALDLSRAVAAELGTIGPGVAHVRAEVVLLP